MRDFGDQAEFCRHGRHGPSADVYKVEVSPWTFPATLDRVAIALDLNCAQFDHDITGVNAGEVLLRVRHPGRSTVHVEVSRQGSEPCIYASAYSRKRMSMSLAGTRMPRITDDAVPTRRTSASGTRVNMEASKARPQREPNDTIETIETNTEAVCTCRDRRLSFCTREMLPGAVSAEHQRVCLCGCAGRV